MRDELLALLEDGPKSSTQLAAWLDRARTIVRHELKAMENERLVKRTGLLQRWALASFQSQTGRPPTIDRTAARAAIDAALRGGPLATEQLMAATGYSRNVIRHECARLLLSGSLQHLGIGRGAKWATATYQAPPAVPPRPRGRPRTTRAVVVIQDAAIQRYHQAARRSVENRVERLIRVEEPAPEGDAVCERCGRRFMRKDGTSGRFCSRDCYERPAPPVSVTRIIDGQEYEAISVGAHPLTTWPDGTSSGSSLSGRTFPVKTS